MNLIFNKIKQALSTSSSKISQGIDQIFFKKKLDSQTLQDLEELLIMSDISSSVAANLRQSLEGKKFEKEVEATKIKETLAQLIENLITPKSKPFTLKEQGLTIILVCGVNGNGKTTTIGKLAANYIKERKKVAIAACDTFRAAAVAQIATWGERSVTVIFELG